jgi:Zn finger protein HypA/HybF involved in hydrogenase expression
MKIVMNPNCEEATMKNEGDCYICGSNVEEDEGGECYCPKCRALEVKIDEERDDRE